METFYYISSMKDKQQVNALFQLIKGKQVRVRTNDRDGFGKLIDKKCWVHGTCDFLGVGNFGLQCTVSRLPIRINSLSDVDLVTDETVDERMLP